MTNPYRWWIFYLIAQSIVLGIEAIYCYYFKIDQWQAAHLFAFIILLSGIAFILLTAQGENNYRRLHKNL